MIVNRTLFDLLQIRGFLAHFCVYIYMCIITAAFCIESFFKIHRILCTVYHVPNSNTTKQIQHFKSYRHFSSLKFMHCQCIRWSLSLYRQWFYDSMWESVRNCLIRTYALRVRQPSMSASAYLYSSLLISWNTFQVYNQW